MNSIQQMNLTGRDLNLLMALDALLAEGSVSRAADKIGLSQPATSHALGRLRQIFNDPLLVRVGTRMDLTPRAEALRAPLAEVLSSVRNLLRDPRFDALTSTRSFSLMMPDLVAAHLAPSLIARVAKSAPSVRLNIVPWAGVAEVNRGRGETIDVIICYDKLAFDGFTSEPLYRDFDVLAVAATRPGKKSLTTLEGFLSARHVAVVARGEPEDPVDTWLLGEGAVRRIAVAVPTYMLALQVAAKSDLVAFVPGRLIDSVDGGLKLKWLRPPFRITPDQQVMFHPQRAEVDAASVWLRSCIKEVARSIGSRTTLEMERVFKQSVNGG